MKNFILISAAVLCIFSCRENKSTTVAPAPAPDTTAVTAVPTTRPVTDNGAKDEPMVDPDQETKAEKIQEKDSVMAFIVSFYSIGSGVDRGQPEKLKAYVTAFGKKANTNIEYNVTYWGREGETDYCFPLKGLPDARITEFINGAKEALRTAEHVHFLENQVCRKGR